MKLKGLLNMASESSDILIKRLKAVKSAYILEADASMARGMEAAAMGLFVKAAELELELAELFRSRSQSRLYLYLRLLPLLRHPWLSSLQQSPRSLS